MKLEGLTDHHAALFINPDRKSFTDLLWNDLHTASHAHVLHNQTVIDIETARTLISWANAPYEGEKVALVSFHTITLPAQNALLKIIEEPRAGVRFIFITTNREAIIPTLYSRLQEQKVIVKNNTAPKVSENNQALLFLSTPHTQRMKLPYIVELLGKVDEEDRKDRESVRVFILSIAEELGVFPEHSKYTLLTLETASYAADPSSSGKALLEYLSLVLPRI